MTFARFSSAPGALRTRSVHRAHEVRVTPRPLVGPLTRGNSRDDNRTSPVMPRVLEGPRSRSGYFHSLPCPVRYGGDRHTRRRTVTGSVSVRPIGTAPPAPSTATGGDGLRRGWPGRGH